MSPLKGIPPDARTKLGRKASGINRPTLTQILLRDEKCQVMSRGARSRPELIKGQEWK